MHWEVSDGKRNVIGIATDHISKLPKKWDTKSNLGICMEELLKAFIIVKC